MGSLWQQSFVQAYDLGAVTNEREKVRGPAAFCTADLFGAEKLGQLLRSRTSLGGLGSAAEYVHLQNHWGQGRPSTKNGMPTWELVVGQSVDTWATFKTMVKKPWRGRKPLDMSCEPEGCI